MFGFTKKTSVVGLDILYVVVFGPGYPHVNLKTGI